MVAILMKTVVKFGFGGVYNQVMDKTSSQVQSTEKVPVQPRMMYAIMHWKEKRNFE